MSSSLRKQESIFFRNCYCPCWIPASPEVPEWVAHILDLLRSALCSMPYAFQGTNITSRYLFTYHLSHLNEEGMIFIK